MSGMSLQRAIEVVGVSIHKARAIDFIHESAPRDPDVPLPVAYLRL